MRTDTQTLASALDVLAREIESGDGIANAAIAEAAERLRELVKVADKITDFKVLGAIAAENGPIGCANYSNLLSLQMTKKGWQATFGLSHEFGEALFKDTSTCVLYVVDRAAFNAKKKELQEAPNA